jgi:hypothetical protein
MFAIIGLEYYTVLLIAYVVVGLVAAALLVWLWWPFATTVPEWVVILIVLTPLILIAIASYLWEPK